MSGLGEDTFPKSKSRPPCSWPVNGGACSIAFVSGQFVVDSGCSNKPTRLGVRRRMPSRRIAGSSRGEERKKNDPPTVDLQDHAFRRLLLQTENQ